MLDPWIIEEIRKREDSIKEEGRRLELPLEKPVLDDHPATSDDSEERGVTVIDL